MYLSFDIGQLGFLIYLTGGITNPFVILLIIPSIFSSQYLNVWSSILLSIQSILDNNPIQNEPGYENMNDWRNKVYNRIYDNKVYVYIYTYA